FSKGSNEYVSIGVSVVSFRAAKTARNPPPKHDQRSVGGRSFAVFAASNDSPSSALRAPSPRMRGEGQQISMLVHVAPRPACGAGVARSAGGGAGITIEVCGSGGGPAQADACAEVL